MIKRLLAVAIAALFGAATFIGLTGGFAGIAWIFLFGDNPWPSWSSAVIMGPAAVGAVVVAIVIYRSIMTWRAPPRAG